MVKGKVTGNLEPKIPIIIEGKRRIKIHAILDTGFSDCFCLSKRFAKDALLELVGDKDYELADGSTITENVYLAKVTFNGETLQIPITLTNSDDSLIGTALLEKNELYISFPKKTVSVK